MTFRGLIRNVLPPPRRPVTVATVMPLAVSLAVFGAACAWLELSDTIEFTQPWAFAFMAAAPWIWWMSVAGYSGLSRVRGTVALVVRLALLGAFAMALAGPRAVRTSDVLAVVYAVDVSDSVGEDAQEAALEFLVRTASEKPEADRAGLVVFGRDAGVEFPPRRSLVFEGSVTRRVSRDGTDLERALSLAAAVLPEAHAGRIVLVSDGVETQGSLGRVLDDLRSRDVQVDVLPVGYSIPHEVWLERLDLPKTVKVGEAYEASVVLSSLQDGSGKLVLRENGQEIFAEEVEFSEGKNRYSLPLRLRSPGYYEYLARIEVPPGRDGWAENNVAVSHLYLEGEGRVLLVTDPAGDARDWTELARALKAAERVVERVGSFDFPRDAMSLMPYDCVVLSNVPADAFDAVQQEALRSAVFNQGTGFIMVGGRNSFGPGGYNRTPVEEALPVTMDVSQRKVMPKGALAIILHTCEFADGNTWGKEIAKAAMRVLSKEDEIGILVFSWKGGAKWLFPLTPASEYQRLVTLVNKAEIGDMPDFGTTMQMGLTGLKSSDAAAKHMIIISDGDPQPPTPKLLQSFVTAQVSVSTVAINPHGGQDISIMRKLAAATGGRYYFAQYAEELPSIFIKEAKTLRRSMIQNKDFTPTIQFPSPILKGIDAMPQLHGYVLTTPKPRSATVLEGPEEEDLDPILATWRYGLGKTAAFTSDLSPNWGRDWLQWDRFRAFVKQLMVDISRVKGEGSLQVRTRAEGMRATVVVEDFKEGAAFLDMRASVSGPGGKVETISLRQTGPRRYEGAFALSGKGQYHLTVEGTGPGRGEEGRRSERAIGGFTVPYSPEYLRFRSDPRTLARIVERTKGRILESDAKGEFVFGERPPPRKSSRSIFDAFLWVIAFLIPLDVGVRRIQLDWSAIFGWFRSERKDQPSGRTMGALLERKRSVDAALGSARDVAPPSPAPRTSAAAAPKPKTSSPAAKPKPKAEEKAPPADVSTTGRLLELKRRMRQKRDGK
jgi:uncharacterized membrane protein